MYVSFYVNKSFCGLKENIAINSEYSGPEYLGPWEDTYIVLWSKFVLLEGYQASRLNPHGVANSSFYSDHKYSDLISWSAFSNQHWISNVNIVNNDLSFLSNVYFSKFSDHLIVHLIIQLSDKSYVAVADRKTSVTALLMVVTYTKMKYNMLEQELNRNELRLKFTRHLTTLQNYVIVAEIPVSLLKLSG